MANFVDEQFGAESSPVDIDNIIPTTVLPPLPMAAQKARAAQTAMLSSSNPVENYQLMMNQAENGDDSLVKAGQEIAQRDAKTTDMKGVMMVLSDPRVPIEVKRQAIAQINDNSFLKDGGNLLFSKSLEAPSKGETVEHEDARISSADAIREIYQSRQDIQGIVNAHGASLNSSGSMAVAAAEMVELNVMPFGNTIQAGKVKTALDKAQGNTSLWQKIKNFALPGTSTKSMADQLERIPPSKRAEFAQTVVKAIQENSGIIFSNDNQFAQYDKATSIFEEGGYSSTQEFIDNVSPLLDLLGVGQLFRGAGKAAKVAGKADKFTPVTDITPRGPRPVGPAQTELPNPQRKLPAPSDVIDVTARIELNNPVSRVNPASPGEVVASANPQRARDLHASMVNGASDEAAQAVYGTSRDQAIINNIYPQATTETGNISAKVQDIDQNLRHELHVPDELVETLNNQSLSMYTPAERAAARANVVNRFETAEGVTMHPAAGSFDMQGGRININAVYGNANGSWVDPMQAFAQIKYALKGEGILDDEIEILARTGLDYVPVKLEDVAGVPGDYLVRVKTSHEIDPTDIASFESLNVKRNWLDRIGALNWARRGGNSGSAARYVMDAASMLHPTITKSASIAADASSRFEHVMLQQASKFTDAYMALPKPSRVLVDDYIKEANYNGIKFDISDLLARGFNQDEIASLRNWKQYWDGQYYLENYDMVRSLNAGGYQILDNNNATLFAKPIAKNSTISRVYDASTNQVVPFAKADGDALYNAGGTLAKLRRPITVNGDTVEHMIVRNNGSEFLRKVRDNDRVLNYRDGYYTTSYKSPRFVDQKIRDANGNVLYTKAIAVAGDTAEAQRFIDRTVTSGGLSRDDFSVRGDVRKAPRDEDAHWDLTSAQGRIAQRVRGKLLEDSSGLNHLGDGSYVVSPVESAIRAARSISGRTVNRPMLDAAKGRFIQQYKELLPSDGMGGVRFPKSVTEITKKGVYSSKELADARTTFEYINYLENGYQNGMDDVFKMFFNTLSEHAGELGLSKIERGAAAVSTVNPTSAVKKIAFVNYLALNPLRQLLLQTHQVVRTLSYNIRSPWVIPKLTGEYLGYKLGQINTPSGFTKWIDQSGMLDSVDKHNLVRGSLTSAADASNPLSRAANNTLGAIQMVGFNAGEQGNILGHAAAVFDRYQRLGRNIADKDVMDDMTAEVRALTYGQNFAGDMPYNQTTLASVLQFAQVPHKAILFATNRQLPRAIRARMMAMDVLLWGVPGITAVSSLVGQDLLPDDPKTRQLVTEGAESMGVNIIFNNFFDEPGMKSHVDFSGLAPYDLTGWGKFFHSMYSDGVQGMVINSPAGQLLFKEGGRVRNMVASVARYFNIIEDDAQTPETFISVANEAMKLSSGWNNGLKAKLMLETGRKMDQYGNTIDKETTNVEAYAQVLGFGTYDEKMFYETSQALQKKSKEHRDATIKAYKDIKRYYAEQLDKPNTDPKFVTAVTGWALKSFADDPIGMSIIYGEWAKDMQSEDVMLLKKIMDVSGIPNPGALSATIKMAPIPEEEKQKALQRINDFATMREKMKEPK